MTAAHRVTREDVEAALSEVLDPCSVAMRRPLDLVTMGLINGIEIVEGKVAVLVLLTDPMCFVQVDIVRAVEGAVLAIPGVTACEVQLDGSVLWTSDRIRPGGSRAGERALAQMSGSASGPDGE